MTYRWPFLDLVGAKSSRDFAERCVVGLAGKSLLQQLSERKVYELRQAPAFCAGAMGISEGTPRGFFIFLDRDLKSEIGTTMTRTCVTFAHEIGYTFGYDLTTLECLPYVEGSAYGSLDDEDGEGNQILTCLEEFADDFSYLWMSYAANRLELEEFLRKYKDESRLDLRSLLFT